MKAKAKPAKKRPTTKRPKRKPEAFDVAQLQSVLDKSQASLRDLIAERDALKILREHAEANCAAKQKALDDLHDQLSNVHSALKVLREIGGYKGLLTGSMSSRNVKEWLLKLKGLSEEDVGLTRHACAVLSRAGLPDMLTVDNALRWVAKWSDAVKERDVKIAALEAKLAKQPELQIVAPWR